MILPVTNASGRTSSRCSNSVLPRLGRSTSDPLEYPPTRDLGDLGTPVAFDLARRLRKAPRVIAQEIAGSFGAVEGCRRSGAERYLNFFLERRSF